MASEPSRFANPRRYVRTRVTASLAQDVAARYERGDSMRNIALTLRIGKATVVKILNAAGVPIKPAGRHYQSGWGNESCRGRISFPWFMVNPREAGGPLAIRAARSGGCAPVPETARSPGTLDLASTVPNTTGVSLHGLLHQRVLAKKMTAERASELAAMLTSAERAHNVTAEDFADPSERRLGRDENGVASYRAKLADLEASLGQRPSEQERWGGSAPSRQRLVSYRK